MDMEHTHKVYMPHYLRDECCHFVHHDKPRSGIRKKFVNSCLEYYCKLE